MWKEQIEMHKDNNPYMKINPPASARAIKAAEKKLEIVFPRDLKELLLELDGDNNLMHSVQQIVENTIMTRKALSEHYEGLSLLLFIGGNGCGDYYSYIITNGCIASNDIIRWEHEDNSRIIVANGLSELIEKYYTDQI